MQQIRDVKQDTDDIDDVAWQPEYLSKENKTKRLMIKIRALNSMSFQMILLDKVAFKC